VLVTTDDRFDCAKRVAFVSILICFIEPIRGFVSVPEFAQM